MGELILAVGNNFPQGHKYRRTIPDLPPAAALRRKGPACTSSGQNSRANLWPREGEQEKAGPATGCWRDALPSTTPFATCSDQESWPLGHRTWKASLPHSLAVAPRRAGPASCQGNAVKLALASEAQMKQP